MAQNPIILITGANTGLGLEMVKALAGSNKAYQVLLGGRSLDKATQAAKAVLSNLPATKSTVSPVQIDIEDDESIQALFELVKAKFGRLDALVNNAGMGFPFPRSPF